MQKPQDDPAAFAARVYAGAAVLSDKALAAGDSEGAFALLGIARDEWRRWKSLALVRPRHPRRRTKKT